jgi:DNA-binding NarL/FixJ family response regulator
MIEKGINSYLLKNVDPDELKKVITILHTKEYFFNEKLSSLVVKALYSKGQKVTREEYCNTLTEREMEVLALICEELTSAEIAEKLFVSRRTIEGHRNSLFEKTGAKNTVGLVLFAIRNGIIAI